MRVIGGIACVAFALTLSTLVVTEAAGVAAMACALFGLNLIFLRDSR